MAPYSFTIFTKKTMIKNVIPFFLDGGIQEENTNANWNGTSSFVSVSTGSGTREINLNSTDSYGRPVKHGVMVTVVKSDTESGQVKVVMDPDFSADGDLDEVLLYRTGQSAMFLFKDSNVQGRTGEWVVLSNVAIPDNIATNASAALKAGVNTFINTNSFNADVNIGNADSDNLKINSEIVLTGTAPTIVATAVGGGTAVLSDESTDAAGIITFANTWANAESATVTFNNAFDRTPVVVASENATTARNFSVSDTTSSSFTITCSGTMAGDVSYIVLGLE